MDNFVTSNIFDRCLSDAENTIEIMRETAIEVFGTRNDIIIGVNGSVARREYTSGSDVDHFFLSVSKDEVEISVCEDSFRKALEGRGLKMPSAGGVFEGALQREMLLTHIGGDDDTNQTLTRRMLFLLEGEWIFNQTSFEELRELLIQKYVSNDLEEDKLALYLLNDIIRYWRTICIDFECKTAGGNKPRAIRLAKLRISRMLLCFAGFVAVAEAINMNAPQKRAHLVKLFAMQGIDRLDCTLGGEFQKAKECYGTFLSKLDDQDFRSKLERPGDEGINTTEFKFMVELAREFKAELVGILLKHYGPDSAIVKSLLL
ncbi:hypothetical protein FDK21_17355 [Cohaesibacter sp. CAU 1516]|uniref:hypothetical protein n=1 Tax=Cohaesibacter sp. CAU 1516 TaxID=2576038 RepID=UPI0010FCFE5F|nr:hypothetical protein [Cohaesibacter sp. CAU 1516]TLP43330.1 hypothetical protein FDK21_17355 [Cohaesibacter sp. CAU 1516]